MIKGIHHSSFTVSNMERSLAFYRDVLGLKVLWDSKAEGIKFGGPLPDLLTGTTGTEQRIAFVTSGDSYIELIEYTPTGKPQVDNKPSDTGSAHVCFNTDNIQSLFERLSENKVRLHCSPQDFGFGQVMYFRDPDGIILEAIQGEFPSVATSSSWKRASGRP